MHISMLLSGIPFITSRQSALMILLRYWSIIHLLGGPTGRRSIRCRGARAPAGWGHTVVKKMRGRAGSSMMPLKKEGLGR